MSEWPALDKTMLEIETEAARQGMYMPDALLDIIRAQVQNYARGLQTLAKASGYRQGERDMSSRERNKPGDGDMGG